jgi:cytochrome c oxidase assembly protein subunit 11
MTGTPHNNPMQRRHRAIAAWCAVLVVVMVGAAYAAVPLYRLFCQVTGFDGTPRIAT